MSASPNGCCYIYDGSFEGLMTVIYEIVTHASMPDKIISQQVMSPHLFHNYIFITTDHSHARKVIHAIQKKLPTPTYSNVLVAFFSETPGVELLITRYLSLGWRYGMRLNHFITHKHAKPFLDLITKIHNEYHRMLGLVRFQQTPSGIYFAQINTNYNILPLLSLHFTTRMQKQQWIIHDTKRNIASIYHEDAWEIVEFEIVDTPQYTATEHFFQDLWSTYFTSISIKERENKKLQKKFIPKRYWQHLIEPIT
jgi:probable DNA metabolism protein